MRINIVAAFACFVSLLIVWPRIALAELGILRAGAAKIDNTQAWRLATRQGGSALEQVSSDNEDQALSECLTDSRATDESGL